MPSAKASFEKNLQRKVISEGRCSGCSACVISCPYDCLAIVEGKPNLKKECKACDICNRACARLEWSWPEIEESVFGRQRKPEDDFGIYRRIAIARAKDDAVLKVCQDGGAVTALLRFALDSKFINCAIESGVDSKKPFLPVPTVSTSLEDTLVCAGTRYFYSRNLLALPVASDKFAKIGFVGVPCQVDAIRKMAMLKLKKYVTPVEVIVGLMCSECFTYEGLMENHISRKLGISPHNIRGMNIKGKLILTMKDGSTRSVSLEEIKQYSATKCAYCDDFSSELADISAGGLGLNGWTFIIVRTETGERLFSAAEKAHAIETLDSGEMGSPLKLLRVLSRKKRRQFDKI
jgi:coenzyme F420 hydrogenase subunit beta